LDGLIGWLGGCEGGFQLLTAGKVGQNVNLSARFVLSPVKRLDRAGHVIGFSLDSTCAKMSKCTASFLIRTPTPTAVYFPAATPVLDSDWDSDSVSGIAIAIGFPHSGDSGEKRQHGTKLLPKLKPRNCHLGRFTSLVFIRSSLEEIPAEKVEFKTGLAQTKLISQLVPTVVQTVPARLLFEYI